MSTPTPHRFLHPRWDLRDVFGWVLDGDPEKFGRLKNEGDVNRALTGTFYTRSPRPERDPNARTTLLHELQRGHLVAHDGEVTLPREYWGKMTESDFRHALRLVIWCWRDDVLRLWPLGKEALANEATPPHQEQPEGDTLRRAPDSEIHKTITTEGAPTASIDDLAEWIFAQHSRRTTFKVLLGDALCAQLGEFRRADFLVAYQQVYESKANRPPATGWPLRSPYKGRTAQR